MFHGGEGGRCIGLTTLPLSRADCLEILGASNSWDPQGLSRPVMGLLCLFYSCWQVSKEEPERVISKRQLASEKDTVKNIGYLREDLYTV
jgi:hypothetical protein